MSQMLNGCPLLAGTAFASAAYAQDKAGHKDDYDQHTLTKHLNIYMTEIRLLHSFLMSSYYSSSLPLLLEVQNGYGMKHNCQKHSIGRVNYSKDNIVM